MTAVEVVRKRGPSLTETDFALAQSKLDQIAQEINQTEEQATRLEKRTYEFKLHVGKLLIEAKEMEYPNGELVLPHGCFTEWAHKKHHWKPRYVQEHAQIYRLHRERQKRGDAAPLVKGYSTRAILAALRGKPHGKEKPKRWWIVTGRVGIAAFPWEGEGEPEATALVAACTDWKVRRG